MRVFKSLSSPSSSSNLLVKVREISVFARWLREPSLFESFESTAPSPGIKQRRISFENLESNFDQFNKELAWQYQVMPLHQAPLPDPAAAHVASHCGLERWLPNVLTAAKQITGVISYKLIQVSYWNSWTTETIQPDQKCKNSSLDMY